MSGPFGIEDPTGGLSPRMVRHYLDLYVRHMNVGVLKHCFWCQKHNCDDFMFARASLIAGGQQLPGTTEWTGE